MDLERFGGVYRLAAAGCAEAVFRAPWVEPVFVRLSRRFSRAPGAGRFIRSVAYRLADRLFATGCGVRDVALEGVPLLLDVGDWTTSGYYFADEPYEPATMKYLADQLRAGAVFVDVGANSGYFTLLAAGLVGPEGCVVASSASSSKPHGTVRHTGPSSTTATFRRGWKA